MSRNERAQRCGKETEVATLDQREKKPWFGKKRIGYGYRPQTWQGWVIAWNPLAVVLIIILIK